MTELVSVLYREFVCDIVKYGPQKRVNVAVGGELLTVWQQTCAHGNTNCIYKQTHHGGKQR